MLTARPDPTGRPAHNRLLTLVREPRIIIDYFAPFDRPIVLTALAGMGLILLVWATTPAVQLVGAAIAAVALQQAFRLFVGEVLERRRDRRAQQQLLATPAPQIGDDIDGDPAAPAA